MVEPGKYEFSSAIPMSSVHCTSDMASSGVSGRLWASGQRAASRARAAIGMNCSPGKSQCGSSGK